MVECLEDLKGTLILSIKLKLKPSAKVLETMSYTLKIPRCHLNIKWTCWVSYGVDGDGSSDDNSCILFYFLPRKMRQNMSNCRHTFHNNHHKFPPHAFDSSNDCMMQQLCKSQTNVPTSHTTLITINSQGVHLDSEWRWHWDKHYRNVCIRSYASKLDCFDFCNHHLLLLVLFFYVCKVVFTCCIISLQ